MTGPRDPVPDAPGAADAAEPPPLHVGFVLMPNFTLTPLAGFIDTLRLAADEGDRSRPRKCRWTVLSHDLQPVRASCGTLMPPWEKLGDPARFDHVVVAGGLLAPVGRSMLDESRLAFLHAARRARRSVIGICTGSFALVEAGLIAPGGECCVSWYHHQDLLDRHPDVIPISDRLWIRRGQITTCAGGTATIDLAAALIRERLGDAVAQKSRHILVAGSPRQSASPQPHPPIAVRARDWRVRRAVLVMEQHISDPLGGEELAQRLAISRRQLERLFRRDFQVSLQLFARDLRLSHAVWLLAHSEAQITEIAGQCGFSDTPHLDRCFRQAFGMPPSTARRLGSAALQRMLLAWWPHGGQEDAMRLDEVPPAEPESGAEGPQTSRRHFPDLGPGAEDLLGG